jgi:hypothetical protein
LEGGAAFAWFVLVVLAMQNGLPPLLGAAALAAAGIGLSVAEGFARRREWAAYGAALGLRPAAWPRRRTGEPIHPFEGAYGGRALRLTGREGGGHPRTAVELQVAEADPAFELTVRPAGLRSKLSEEQEPLLRRGKLRPFATGDTTFDAAYVVATNDPARARAFLDAASRLAVQGLGAFGLLKVGRSFRPRRSGEADPDLDAAARELRAHPLVRRLIPLRVQDSMAEVASVASVACAWHDRACDPERARRALPPLARLADRLAEAAPRPPGPAPGPSAPPP